MLVFPFGGFILLAGCAMPVSRCTIAPVAFMDISFLHHAVPVFDAAINGRPVRMLIDSGAGISALTPNAAEAADLPRFGGHEMRVSGLGGTFFAPMVTVRNFRIGNANGFVLHFVVTPIFGAWQPFSDAARNAVAGIFGADILRNYDVDLDFPDHHVLLLKVTGCGDAAPWAGARPIRFDLIGNGQIIFPITVEGRPMQALLDTGSSLNQMPASLFRDSGLEATGPEHVGSGTGHGIGGRTYRSDVYRFRTASIGGVAVDGPIFTIGGESPAGDYALVGERFIRQHEIYISYQTRTLYIRPARAVH